MLGLAFIVVIAWRMADFEDRNPWPWSLGALLVALSGAASRGVWQLLSFAVAIFAVAGGLWILRMRDERIARLRPGSRVIR